jgi:hypothetical protein
MVYFTQNHAGPLSWKKKRQKERKNISTKARSNPVITSPQK